MRHELRVRGKLVDHRDLSHEIDLYLPFYFGNDSPVPHLLNRTPERGTDAGVHDALELAFSVSMDRGRTEGAFSVSPDTEVDFSWNGDATRLTIEPSDQWKPLTYHRWSIATGARSADGVAPGSTISGSFITQVDADPPRLLAYRTAARENGDIVETTDLAPDGVVLLEFSKPVRFGSVREAVTTTPAVAEAVEQLSETDFLLRFDERLEIDREYEIVISEELRDLSGNRLLRERRLVLEPVAPRQTIEALESVWSAAGGTNAKTLDTEQGPGETAVVGVGSPDGTNILQFDFAHPYESATTRSALLEAVEVQALLPERAVNPDIERISWMSGGLRVRISYAGLRPSDSADEPTIYRIRIAAGEASAADTSLGLEEPVELFIETEVQE